MSQRILSRAFVTFTCIAFASIAHGQTLISSITTQSLGTPSNGVPADPNAAYSALTGSYFAFTSGGSTSGKTAVVCDDFDVAPQSVGQSVTSIRLAVSNIANHAFSARIQLGFWLADGAGGLPGTYLNQGSPVGYILAPTTIQPGFNILTADLGGSGFTLTGQRLWIGYSFDNTGSTASGSDLALLGLASVPSATVGGTGLGIDSGGVYGVPFGQPLSAAGGIIPTTLSLSYELVVPAPPSFAPLAFTGLLITRRRR